MNVKRTFFAALLVATTALAAAQTPPAPKPAPTLGERAEALAREGLPVCSTDVKQSVDALVHKLPPNLSGEVIRIESPRMSCAGQWVAVTSREGGFFLGVPWFLDGMSGSIEAKLKRFAWQNLQQNMDAVVGTKATRDGLFPVTIYQTTERGKIPLDGEIDPDGTVLFIGHFHPLNADYLKSRLSIFQPFIDASPVTGASNPAVTVVEFSDFECPSCQHASKYMEPILQKFGSQVRYVRFDLPLVTLHPWAFSAALAGRAIWDQKPDLFWEFKKEIYANQDSLTAFTVDQFTRGFAKDHDLDLAKFDAEVSSPELTKTLLAGLGAALSNDIRSTPTYLVNGANVDPGDNGKHLEEYVAGLLKKQ